MKMGDKITAALYARGWTSYQLAKAAGVNTANVRNIELERVKSPSVHIVSKIAGALEIPLAEFIDEGNHNIGVEQYTLEAFTAVMGLTALNQKKVLSLIHSLQTKKISVDKRLKNMPASSFSNSTSTYL